MKKCQSIFLLLCSFAALCIAQTAPDFTATDVNGKEHNLYSYLDKGMYALLLLSSPTTG